MEGVRFTKDFSRYVALSPVTVFHAMTLSWFHALHCQSGFQGLLILAVVEYAWCTPNCSSFDSEFRFYIQQTFLTTGRILSTLTCIRGKQKPRVRWKALERALRMNHYSPRPLSSSTLRKAWRSVCIN